MEILLILFVLLLVLAFSALFMVFVLSLADDIWISIFKKPLYVHLYFFPKKVSQEVEFILRQKLQFYNKLTDKQKVYFHHRMVIFNNNYQFISRESFLISKEV